MSDRRKFILGLAALGSGAAMGLPRRAVTAARGVRRQTLRGDTFNLEIREMPVNITGRPRMAMLINGQLPGPILRWREGDTVTLRVTNRMNISTSLHWHGVVVPTNMDGVPGISYPGIAPGQTFVYRFPVRQSGTFWYHSHTRFQEQNCLTGALVIEPRTPDPVAADRDYVVQLNDWTDEDPERIFYHLKTDDGYYNYHKRTAGDFFRDVSMEGLRTTLKDRGAWGRMRMSPRDLRDVSGAQTGGTYTYLINGQPPASDWTGLFKRGERVRLRFINSSAMSYYDVRIPGLKMTVIAADGSNVEPVTVDEFRIGVAETYDVIVEPTDDAHTIFAQAMDRSGYARATLAVRDGLSAPVPPMDPIFNRTMLDMGMAGGMDKMKKTGKMAKGRDNMKAMAGGMKSMSGGLRHISGVADYEGTKIYTGGPNASGQIAYPQPKDVSFGLGPEVVHIARSPTERLNRPGDGLNGNGRRVLTYADLVRLESGPQNIGFYTRDPDADVLLHLTGNMDRYIFGLNGLTYDQSEPVRFPHGQRIRVTLVNDTMMEHPIHLHGLFTELDNHRGRLRPLKHTVSVKPGEKVHYYVNATEVGRWAYHCHLLYHLAAGMFTTAIVA
jgi:CopA family copper-resistance protein